MIIKRISKRKVGQIMTVIAVSLIVLGSSLIVIHNGLDQERDGTAMSSISDDSIIDDDHTFRNFQIQNDSIPKKGIATGSVYSITMFDYSLDAMNKTIGRLFGNVISNSTIIMKLAPDSYKYRNDQDEFWINPRGALFYTRMGESVEYSQKEIDIEENLLNSSECREVAEVYLQDLLGAESKDFYFTHEGSDTTVLNNGSIRISGYTYRFSRMLENLSVFKDAAGFVSITVSPNATVTNAIISMPSVRREGVSSFIGPEQATKKIDTYFQDYRMYLLAGFDNFTLVRMELAYGLVDQRLEMGWCLFFAADGDMLRISSAFVH